MLYGFDEDLGCYYAPKRRRSPDNPYRLHRKEDGSIWVSFTDGVGREQEVQVDALGKWENMMLDSMEGNCVFTQEQIKRRMDTLREKLQNLEQTMGELQNKIDHSAEYRTKKETHPFGWISFLVDLRRFELPTPTMRMWCAPGPCVSRALFA